MGKQKKIAKAEKFGKTCHSQQNIKQ